MRRLSSAIIKIITWPNFGKWKIAAGAWIACIQLQYKWEYKNKEFRQNKLNIYHIMGALTGKQKKDGLLDRKFCDSKEVA